MSGFQVRNNSNLWSLRNVLQGIQLYIYSGTQSPVNHSVYIGNNTYCRFSSPSCKRMLGMGFCKQIQSLEEKEWKQLPLWEFLDGVCQSPWALKKHHPSCGKQVMKNCPLVDLSLEKMLQNCVHVKIVNLFSLTLIDLIEPNISAA